MNLFLIGFLSLLFSMPQADTISEEDATQKAVLEWADSLFAAHENYKFENFKAHYTDDYFIQTMRLETYQEKIDALQEKKDQGTYNGSDEQFKNDINKLTKAINEAKEKINTIPKVTHYETHFWTNIKTTDGITVYYELIVKLDHTFVVTEAKENSSIGKTSESKIAYKPGVTGNKVTEK